MSKGVGYKDRSLTIGKYGPGLRFIHSKEGWTIDGHVVTPQGIVAVKVDFPTKNGRTYLEFVYLGRLHTREYDCWFSPIVAGRMARQFALDITNNA